MIEGLGVKETNGTCEIAIVGIDGSYTAVHLSAAQARLVANAILDVALTLPETCEVLQ